MVMGRVGKVRSFKVSPRVLFWTFLFLLLYLPLSVLVVNHWVDLRRETKTRKEAIDRLELDLAKAERALFKFRQHVTLLETYIESLESGQERRAAVPAEMSKPEPAAAEEPPLPQAEEAVEPDPPEPEVQGLVDVQRMTIEPEGGAVQVSFNLMNITEGEEPVSGYVHILAAGDEDGSPWWKVYPRGEVAENGIPESYRKGQPFIIQRFKPIQGRFGAEPGRGLPDSIRVVVYDDTGRLIYSESFEVNHAS
jgi:hypothetical protein